MCWRHTQDGGGAIDGDEFREMLPLLAGEHLPFEKVESLFAQADRDQVRGWGTAAAPLRMDTRLR